MRKHLTKAVLALVCLTLVSMPLSAQKGKPGGGGGSTGSSACAVVTTPMLSANPASPGTGIGVFSRVGNCSSGRQRFTITITATSACGEETVISSGVITFDGGQYMLISSPYQIAPDTCAGQSTVTVSVYAGGSKIASGSTILTIQ